MFKHPHNINDIKKMYVTDMQLYYACLYPKFQWFDKTFSISKIVEPISAKIVKHDLYPDIINNTDRTALAAVGYSRILRKFNHHVYLDSGDQFVTKVYEYIDKTAILNEKFEFVGATLEQVLYPFYKSLVQLKLELDNDLESTIIKDDNFEIFNDVFEKATEMYPELIIKILGNNKPPISLSKFCTDGI